MIKPIIVSLVSRQMFNKPTINPTAAVSLYFKKKILKLKFSNLNYFNIFTFIIDLVLWIYLCIISKIN